MQIHNKSESDFSICFGGENEIEIKTLIDTLNSTLELINYVANEEDKDAFMKINVRGTRKGSFVVELAALAGVVPTLLNTQNVNLAKTCIDSVCGLLNIKKHLKGEKPKSVSNNGETVKIENNDCEKIEIQNYIFNFYNEQTDSMISKVFSSCNRDYFKIKRENEELVCVDKSEFGHMTKQIEIQETSERIISNTTEIELKIKKPDFTGNSQWELTDLNNKKTFKASVEDESFIYKVHSGDISINSKTTIIVRLYVETTINELNEVIKDIYIVKEVKKIVKNNLDLEQLTLNN